MVKHMVNAHKQAQGWLLTASHTPISCSRFSPSTASPMRSGLTKTSGYTASTCSPPWTSSFALIPVDILNCSLCHRANAKCMIGTKAKEEKAGRVGVLCLLLNLSRNACVHTHWMCTPLCNVVYMPVLRGFTCMQQVKKILGVGPNISMHGVPKPLRYLARGILRDTFVGASPTRIRAFLAS